jgi:hypothetical protein
MGIAEDALTKILKDRENPPLSQKIIGLVLQEEPNLIIEIDERGNTFTNEQIIVFDSLMLSYQREVEIELEGEIEDEYTESVLEPNDRTLKTSKSNYTLKGTGKMTWTDTLKLGQQVLCEVIDDGESLLVYGVIRRLE